MNRRFYPSFRSFLGSLAFDFSPLVIVGAVYYFKGSHTGILLGILSVVMIAISALQFLQTCIVHLVRLEIAPGGIRTKSALGPSMQMAWRDVIEATLRERKNPVSRTDHLLILRSAGGMMNYPLSILKRSEEAEVIEELQRRTRLGVVEDRPAI
jgi:hypothetical protein